MKKRYCEMCDSWLTKRICPACGMVTLKAAFVWVKRALEERRK